MIRRTILPLFLLLTTGVGASEFKSGEQVNLTNAVKADAYVAAGEVNVDAPVWGDLIVAGGDITVSDSVRQDLTVAGGDIQINGFVGDDIRIAGGDITITGRVAGDVILFGGDLTVKSDSIEGDLVLFGGSLNSRSHIGGDVRVYGGDVTLGGSVAGALLIESGELDLDAEVFGRSKLVAGEMSLRENAKFYNDVEYYSGSGELDFSEAMVSGNATYNESLKESKGEAGFRPGAFRKTGLLYFLWSFFAGVLLIVVLNYLFKKVFARSGLIYQERLLMNFFYGVLFYIVTPIVIIVAFITVIGIPVGLVLAAAYLVILLLTTALTALILANWINQKWQKDWGSGIIILVAAVSLLFLKVVNMIPFLGWLLVVIFCCAAIGTLVGQVIGKGRSAAVPA